MRVLLASAPHADTFGYSMPPPGLLRLGGALLRAGVDVRLEDLAHQLAARSLPEGEALFEAAAERLLEPGVPELLGLSCMGATLPAALLIARHARDRAPALPIILGGPGTTGVDSQILERFPWIDLVVRGEGELTVVELARRRESGRDWSGVEGITWRAPTGEVLREPERPPIADLGELPDYAWRLLPSIARYKQVTGEQEGLVPIDSGRGCVYDCSFCTIGRFWGRRSRTLPVANLVREIEALRELPSARRAYLCHDIFGADREHALALCSALEERGSAPPFEVRARVDHLDSELIAAMARAGCYRVLLGVESAAPSVRAACDKRLGPEVDVLGVVEELIAAGITPILSFILGLPGEGSSELRATLDLALAASLRGGTNLSLHLPNPQAGCGLGETHAADSRPLEGIPPDMAMGAGESEAERELIGSHPDLFSSWSLLTGLPGGAEHLYALHELAGALPPVLERYPRTFALLVRRAGGDVFDLWERWRAGGVSFEEHVRASGDAAGLELLAWEDAAARIAGGGRAGDGMHPRTRAELVAVDASLPELARALACGEPLPEPSLQRRWLALVPGDRGARTLSISDDIARVLSVLDGRTSPTTLGLVGPEGEAVLAKLQGAGLIDPGPRDLLHSTSCLQ